MSKPIWVRLRSVLERDADASSVELSRESADEMLAEIKRLTAENEKLGRDYQSARDAHDKVLAENEKLRAALELWHLAIKIDVTMEGPQYMGVSFILGRQAWERTRAALGGEND